MGLEKGAKTGRDRPRQAKTGQDRTREERGERREERRERREERGERREKESDRRFCAEGGEGFASLLGGYLPRAWGRGGPDGLGLLIATFLPSGRPSFFHHFFDAIFDRFWLDFASQLGSTNPPKSMKNQCSEQL